MISPTKSIRMKPETIREVEELTRQTRMTFSAQAAELISEAARCRRHPGIVFADGATGRRARIEGTGLEVWELANTYRLVEKDEARLAEVYDWLTDRQRLAAVGYYRSYPDEIDELIRQNEDDADQETQLPFARRAAG